MMAVLFYGVARHMNSSPKATQETYVNMVGNPDVGPRKNKNRLGMVGNLLHEMNHFYINGATRRNTNLDAEEIRLEYIKTIGMALGEWDRRRESAV